MCTSTLVHCKCRHSFEYCNRKEEKSVKKGGAKITLHSSCHDKQLKLFTI